MASPFQTFYFPLLTKYFCPRNTTANTQISTPEHQVAVNNMSDTREEHPDEFSGLVFLWQRGSSQLKSKENAVNQVQSA